MAKPKSKTTRKSKKKAKPKFAWGPFLARNAVTFMVGAVVGLSLVGAAAVAVFAWAPDRELEPVYDATSGEKVTLVAPSHKPAVPAPVREDETEMEPAIDPAPQPPAPVAVPAPRLQLPPTPTGVLPWQKFAKPTPVETGPRVAIVIDDAGLDHHRTARIIALPAPLTVSFLTYGEGLGPQVRAASSAGHELMVHVAMQAQSRSMDPGPDVLLRDIEPDEILARLTRVLAKFDGYVGINNHMGSLFTADRPGMQVVLSELKRRGLLFLDSRTGPHTVGGEISRSLQLPYAERDVFLDNDLTTASVTRQLAEVERVARA
ncbi:MAG: uncharacterized protein K0Q70_1000, partial [Rhodospirillales bacterium]|nr:uncharacterized protein [Rhodospirillales bacterium]